MAGQGRGTENDALLLARADEETWRSARALVARHGQHAPAYALQCVNLAVEIGNADRAARWRLVMHAARKLLADDRMREPPAP